MAIATDSTVSSGDQDDDVDDRDVRAATEYLYVLPIAPGMFEVYSEDGHAYTVDIVEGRCTCRDHQHRRVDCKHIRRVEMAVGEREVPDGVDVDELLAQRPAVQDGDRDA